MIILQLTQDELTSALQAAFHDGFRDFLVGTMVAALPMFWFATLSFYMMRPYAIRTLRKPADPETILTTVAQVLAQRPTSGAHNG